MSFRLNGDFFLPSQTASRDDLSPICRSEDLSAFLMEQGVPTAYLHSGVKPMQRLELLRQLRNGDIDVIVGVNLLREVGFLLADRMLFSFSGELSTGVFMLPFTSIKRQTCINKLSTRGPLSGRRRHSPCDSHASRPLSPPASR